MGWEKKVNDKYGLIRFNLIFWSVFFLYQWLGLGGAKDLYFFYFKRACWMVPIAMAVTYLSIHFLFERYYLKKRTLFWIAEIGLALFFVLIIRSINYYLIYPHFYPEGNLKPLLFVPKLLVEFVNLYLVVALYGLFIFMRSWFQQQQALQDIKKEKMAAELDLLKSQVQPHFIFNMLNNIYSGALKKSPETADQILKLSNFIEYSLYDSQKERVSLAHELSYIKDYLDLQKVRLGEKLDVSINIYNSLEGINIPPMLLLPLIENCFKHGVNLSLDKSWIRMDVSSTEDYLNIKVENSLENTSQNKPLNIGGLGLKNVKRRLELLYPNMHDFKTYLEVSSYLVNIKLKIFS